MLLLRLLDPVAVLVVRLVIAGRRADVADTPHDLVLDESNLILEDVVVLLPRGFLIERAELRFGHGDLVRLPLLLLLERVGIVRVLRVPVPRGQSLEPFVRALLSALVVGVRHLVPVVQYSVHVPHLLHGELVDLLAVLVVLNLLLRQFHPVEQVLLVLDHALELLQLLHLSLLQVLLPGKLSELGDHRVALLLRLVQTPSFQLHLFLQRELTFGELPGLLVVPAPEPLLELFLLLEIPFHLLLSQALLPGLLVLLVAALALLPSPPAPGGLPRALPRGDRLLVLVAVVAAGLAQAPLPPLLILGRSALLLRGGRGHVVVLLVVQHGVGPVPRGHIRRLSLIALVRARAPAGPGNSRHQLGGEGARRAVVGQPLRRQLRRQRSRIRRLLPQRDDVRCEGSLGEAQDVMELIADP